MLVFLFVVVGWLFSLCLHEYAHARVAYAGGDLSVAQKGYLSLNPMRYTHPQLSLLFPLLILLLGGIGLPGGAVYIERSRLRNRHWEAAVSLAGPAANLALMFGMGAVLRHARVDERQIWPALAFLAELQVMAVVLNLLPVPPLDGYGVVAPYLPLSWRRSMDQASGWAIWVVFLALWFVGPVRAAFWGFVLHLSNLAGIPPQLAWEGLQLFRFWQMS